ncbi:cytochrome c-type biogenesis protein CcmH [bacterium endosymbiont of Escarpia laminata]|nr:MAG: cytochrome c-type biogenesis protein CcmH [bacterium endosymbiont of Escarpia laminata]
MMFVRIFLLSLFFLISVTPLSAATLADYTFEDAQKAADFRNVIEEMRCLVCQNESLAGSNAELAVDLRNEIFDMMTAGQGKDDVIRFMVARYGDFVLYDPPMKPSTYPLWFGPLFLLLIGAVLLIRALRKKSVAQETELSDNEQQRLDTLLKQPSDSKDAKK